MLVHTSGEVDSYYSFYVKQSLLHMDAEFYGNL